MAVAHWHASHWIGQDTAGGSVNTPTLSWTDAEDGTGGTITIADSTAGTTNTVYYQSFGGSLGTGTWTSGGSRTGDGGVTLTLSEGHYWFYAHSTDGTNEAASAVYYGVVTSSTTAVLYQILDAVKSRILTLSLSGIASTNVVVKKLPLTKTLENDSLTAPIVIITPTRDQQPPNEGVTNKDDVTYGVLVTCFDKDNKERTFAANLAKYALWRQQISRAFRNQRLPGVTEVITASAEPQDYIDLPRWAAQWYATAILLRFTARETRGI